MKPYKDHGFAYPDVHEAGGDLRHQGLGAGGLVPVVFDHFGGAQQRSGSSSLDLPISWRWSVQARLMSKFLAPTQRPS